MSTMGKVVPVAALAAVALYWFYARAGGSAAVALPAPAVDVPRAVAASAEPQTVVLAGGCFWGVEAVFKHVKGVTEATSGYAGGSADTAQYELVSDGNTGHAESVRVTFDPAQVSLGQLLQVFFSVAHDPTEVNRQGPDAGTQYRSAIFVSGRAEARGRRVHRAARSREGVPAAHRDRGRPADGVLPGGGVPPELRGAAPGQSVHRAQRRAQGHAPARDVSGALPRALIAAPAVAHEQQREHQDRERGGRAATARVAGAASVAA